MMKQKLLIFMTSLILPLATVHSALSEHEDIFKHLKTVTEKYSKETGLHSKFKRTSVLSLLGETESSKGELYYSKKRLRLEMNGKDKSMVLITPDEIWNVSYDEQDKITNIIKSKPISNPLINLLFGNKEDWDMFEVVSVHQNTDKRMDVTLKPKEGSKVSYVSKARFVLDKNRNIVKELTYWDDVDNKTEMRFTYNKFKNQISEQKFKFVPPKDSTVTVM